MPGSKLIFLLSSSSCGLWAILSSGFPRDVHTPEQERRTHKGRGTEALSTLTRLAAAIAGKRGYHRGLSGLTQLSFSL
ncbi:conserved hypothetical protein [Ricinus communis]|uniref:Secreted protein n=1 Tax=Ricinus communis TaxID=3988 RepID=B9S5C7_RICCO|nr:conserved hypothetical protein [Ricinus communis]